MTTLLMAEHDNASIKDATNKALTAAAALGGDVHVLVAGENARAAAEAAAKLSASRKSCSPIMPPMHMTWPSPSRL